MKSILKRLKKIQKNTRKTINKIIAFPGSILQEIKKVEFPSFKESVKMTSVVLIISILLTLILLGIDFIFTSARNYLTTM